MRTIKDAGGYAVVMVRLNTTTILFTVLSAQ